MPSPLKPLDYQEVMDTWRKEKDLKSLAEIRRDFFPEVKSFVDRLKEEAQAEAAKDPYSTKTRSLNGQVANVTEKVTQVFEIRMEKILRMAIRGASGGKVDNSRMVEEEKAYFERVFTLTKEIRSREIELSREQRDLESQPARLPDAVVPDKLDPGTETKADESCVVAAPKESFAIPIPTEPNVPFAKEPEMMPPIAAVQSQAKLTTSEVAEERQDGKGLLVLRILEDIPPFAGPLGDYRLRREDVATLPAGIARALIKRGKAVEIVVART